MSTFTEPVMTFATATGRVEPRTSVAGQPRQRATAVARRRGRAVDTSASTEELLRQRDRLPATHADGAVLRARAIEMNLPMARQLARRYTGRGELPDDLAQVAAVALSNAVDRYDPGRQVPFAAFATPSILGTLKRHFRDTAWAMRVPRSIQELALKVLPAADELGQQHGRAPTTAELAAHLHVTAADIMAAAGAWQKYRLPSLNEALPDTGTDLLDALGGIDPRYASVDNLVSLRLLVAELPLRERRILTMRFYEYMTQSQIAAELGVSQMHVSRLLNGSLARLRTAMLA